MNPSDINPEITGGARPKIDLSLPVVIEPKGNRLRLMPTGIWMLIDLPDQRAPTKAGKIILPGTYKPRPESRYEDAEILEVGPAVTGYKKGDHVLVDRAQVDICHHHGHVYNRIHDGGVVGIIQP